MKLAKAGEYLEFLSAQYIRVTQKPAEKLTYDIKGLDFVESLSVAGEIRWKNSFPNHLVAGTDIRAEADATGIALKNWRDQILGHFPFTALP